MSFQQGLSGLNATSKNLQVIGNNIANANTFGSKVARAEFSDVYATALSGAGTNNIGIGVNLASVSQQFTQGNIKITESPMDLAINGAGFFQVTDERSAVSFSRNGQFKVNREGFITNSNNLPYLENFPVRDEIEKRLGTPIILENDANAAALGETWQGAGRDVDSLVLVKFCSDVGSVNPNKCVYLKDWLS